MGKSNTIVRPSKDSFANRIGRLSLDSRNQTFVRHSYGEMVSQCVNQILCGHEDANDCDRLRKNSVLKMAVRRRPLLTGHHDTP